MTPWRRRFFKGVAVVCGALLLCAMALIGTVLTLLRPSAGEWQQEMQWGPWRQTVSVATLVRMATHPLTLRLLEGRSFQTPHGTVRLHATPRPDVWRVVCAPCTVRRPELGAQGLRLPHAEFTLGRNAQWQLHGAFALGEGRTAVRGTWTSEWTAEGTTLAWTLPDTPMAHAFALVADSVPEVKRARIDGRMRLDAQLQLPSNRLTLRPRIEGFAVSGLGTEALLNAQPGCAARHTPIPAHAWLARAVVAAEDQRFHQHPGYDLDEIAAAWSLNQQRSTVARGGSTLSQQLAKLLYTGSQRSPTRKLRELLYAVELDRTLGKARVLQLYLAVAPWGEGQCGARAAASHHVGKAPENLTPIEAAWLASLLHRPDGELAQTDAQGHVNRERVAWVLENLRPSRPAQRVAWLRALDRWSPPGLQPTAPAP